MTQRRASLSATHLLATGLLAMCFATPTLQGIQVVGQLDSAAFARHAKYLSSDALLGRATGTPGADSAAVYITEACRSAGLQPVLGSYRHAVPLQAVALEPSSSLTFARLDDTLTFSSRDVMLPRNPHNSSLMSFAGSMILVGTSVPSEGSVRNKVVISLGTLSTAVLDSLHELGAVGAIAVIPSWNTYSAMQQSLATKRFVVQDLGHSSLASPLPMVLAQPAVGRALLRTASGGQEPPIELPGHVAVTMDVNRVAVRGDNVLCQLEGREQPGRAIVMTAHYDHLGIEANNTGDSIFNGFSDNAAGVAMLLTVADAWRYHPPQHSVLFVFFTGEERGLLGSDHFVSASPWPLDSIVGVINLDAGAPPAPPAGWEIAGGANTPLGDLAVRTARDHNWNTTVSTARPNSDYFPFARVARPSIFIIPHRGKFEGLTPDSSEALLARWDRYHHPDDEWSDAFPLAGVMRYAEYAWLVARALDELPGGLE